MPVQKLEKIFNPQRIAAHTTTDDPRMISILEKRGFTITRENSGPVVNVAKDL